MDCPGCSDPRSRVLETRRFGETIRRRRQCRRCGDRFSTEERRVEAPLQVRKRDGSRETFDRAKVERGLARAAYKRPVSDRDIEEIGARVEGVVRRGGGEVGTEQIGDMCLEELRAIDRIAYLQFAAVYRAYGDIDGIEAELRSLRSGGPGGR